MKTVAFIHGWAGGNWLIREFTDSLEDAGFHVVNNPQSADIIIAHSAGCYRLPKNIRPELIMFIGMPYWPGLSLLSRLSGNRRASFPKIIASKGKLGLAWILLRRTISVILHPTLTISAVRNHKRLDVLDETKRHKIILIRNKDDTFCTPQIKSVIKSYDNIKYAELPGDHDDYYTNPKPYVDLLKKELQ